MIAYVDGIVPLDEAKVPLDDRMVLLGDGVFESLRTHNGTLCFLDQHMERLAHSLRVMGFRDATAEARNVAQALTDAPGIEGPRRVRVNVSPGRMRGLIDGSGTQVTGLATPLAPTAGPVIMRSSAVKKNPEDPLCGIKHASYAPFIWARRDAVAHGAHDALLWNTHGRVAEGSTSNVFAIVDGVVHSPGPSEGALGGVTRSIVLGLCDTFEEQLTRDQLDRASEVWITNTSSGPVAVSAVDDRAYAPGPMTAKLAAAYQEVLDG